MTKVRYFQYDPTAGAEPASLPAELTIRCWRPAADGFPPRGSRRVPNHFWWAMTKLGGFARSGFAELRIDLDGQTAHRLIVTPGWYRFPFMAPEDLQIGDVWTAPGARRKGLARVAIGEAHRRFGGDAGKFWYVVDEANSASAELARSCGYKLVATGRRTRRLGSRHLGQYVIDRYV